MSTTTAARDGVTPRAETIEKWQDTFLSWSIVTQENELRTLQVLHKHAKRGRFAPAPAAAPPADKPADSPTGTASLDLREPLTATQGTL